MFPRVPVGRHDHGRPHAPRGHPHPRPARPRVRRQVLQGSAELRPDHHAKHNLHRGHHNYLPNLQTESVDNIHDPFL